MNISIVTAYSDIAKSYGDITFQINRRYAKKHGYQYIVIRLKEPESHYGRPYSWMRLPVILKVFREKSPEWVMWVDADACFTNFNRKIEGLINTSYEQIITSDGALNCGVWILKNSEYNVKFINELWAQTDLIHDIWHEQRALIRLYKNNFAGCQSKIQIIDKMLMNSYYPGDWKPGHFICHTPGEPEGARVCLFEGILKKMGDEKIKD